MGKQASPFRGGRGKKFAMIKNTDRTSPTAVPYINVPYFFRSKAYADCSRNSCALINRQTILLPAKLFVAKSFCPVH